MFACLYRVRWVQQGMGPIWIRGRLKYRRHAVPTNEPKLVPRWARFGLILDPLLAHDGPILGPYTGPSWAHVGPIQDQRRSPIADAPNGPVLLIYEAKSYLCPICELRQQAPQISMCKRPSISTRTHQRSGRASVDHGQPYKQRNDAKNIGRRGRWRTWPSRHTNRNASTRRRGSNSAPKKQLAKQRALPAHLQRARGKRQDQA